MIISFPAKARPASEEGQRHNCARREAVEVRHRGHASPRRTLGESPRTGHQQHTDPGGNLPGWLVNQFVKNTPYQSLKKLAEKANEEQYKHAKLIYNIDGVAIAFNNTPEKQEFNMANNFGLAKIF